MLCDKLDITTSIAEIKCVTVNLYFKVIQYRVINTIVFCFVRKNYLNLLKEESSKEITASHSKQPVTVVCKSTRYILLAGK